MFPRRFSDLRESKSKECLRSHLSSFLFFHAFAFKAFISVVKSERKKRKAVFLYFFIHFLPLL